MSLVHTSPLCRSEKNIGFGIQIKGVMIHLSDDIP